MGMYLDQSVCVDVFQILVLTCETQTNKKRNTERRKLLPHT